MKDVAKERGLDPALLFDTWRTPPDSEGAQIVTTGGIYVCDFDRDGILDVLITDVTHHALYKGLPDGTFRDVTTEVGLGQKLPQSSDLAGLAAWVDIDGDGWDDLILGNHVYRNEGGKHFIDYTPLTNLKLPSHTAAIVVADYDRDGKLDLYVTRTGHVRASSWVDGTSGDEAGNLLLRNKGNWQFEDVTARAGAAGGRRSSFTAVWLDADGDGWPDLFVPNEFGNGVLLVNNRDGTFREQPLGPGPVDFGTMGVAAGDLDNDGRIDLYCANMYSKAGSRVIGNLRPDAYSPEVMAKMRQFVVGSQLHLNKGALEFEQAGPRMQVAAVGWSYGPALADLDNDGWLDIYATCGFMSRDPDKPDG
jgi:hypothetical protein